MSSPLITISNLRLAAQTNVIQHLVIESTQDGYILKAKLQAIDHLFTVKGTRGLLRQWKSLDKLAMAVSELLTESSTLPKIELRISARS